MKNEEIWREININSTEGQKHTIENNAEQDKTTHHNTPHHTIPHHNTQHHITI